MQSAKLGNLGKENVWCVHLLRNQNLLEKICWGQPAILEPPWLMVLVTLGLWLLVFGSCSLALGPCMALGSWLCMDGYYIWLLHGVLGSWSLALVSMALA